jgi:hypothetical protein
LAAIFVAGEDVAAAERNRCVRKPVTVDEAHDAGNAHPTPHGSNEILLVVEVVVFGLKPKPVLEAIRRDGVIADRDSLCTLFEKEHEGAPRCRDVDGGVVLVQYEHAKAERRADCVAGTGDPSSYEADQRSYPLRTHIFSDLSQREDAR